MVFTLFTLLLVAVTFSYEVIIFFASKKNLLILMPLNFINFWIIYHLLQ